MSVWPQRLAVVIAVCFGVFAHTSVAAETRFALIIGNSEYREAGTLPNAVRDADLMETAFKAVGFETQTLKNLDEEAMGQALDALVHAVENYDVVAVYYAGHGIQRDGENYLIPVDARLETEQAIDREAIRLNPIIDVLSKAKVSLLFLDACRDNPLADALASRARAEGRSVRRARGLAVVQPVGDTLIAYATLPNAVAFDGTGENSPFARSLAHHMKTPNLEISVAMKRITADVFAETDGAQRPQQLSQMQREFFFVRDQQSGIVRNELRSLLTVYPRTVETGEEVALVADIEPSCRPEFFNLTASGRVTPIPTRFFRQVTLSTGLTRYEISPGSRYGLIVQEDDERGTNWLGFYCLPASAAQLGAKQLLSDLYQKFQSGALSGELEMKGTDLGVAYMAEAFQID